MKRGRSSSDSSSSDGPTKKLPMCVICDQDAASRGPFSKSYLCSEHLSVDVAEALKLKQEVEEGLRAYLPAGAANSSAGLVVPQLRQNLHQRMLEQKTMVDGIFDDIQKGLDSFRARLTDVIKARIDIANVWQRDLDDIDNYNQEMSLAEAARDMEEVVQLAMSMQMSLPDLKADFDRVQTLIEERSGAELELERLRQLKKLVGGASEDAGLTNSFRNASVTAKPEEIDGARLTSTESKLCPIVFSHEVKLDGPVTWLALCSDTSGFVGDSSGCVVAANAVHSCTMALPQPSIFARIKGLKDHLQVLSVDGSKKLRCYCEIDWKNGIYGLNCDHQLLYIAQAEAVTVTDLSGQKILRIHPGIDEFGKIGGIGISASSVFVSSGNKIAVFSKTTSQMETLIALSKHQHADLSNLVIHGDFIFATDMKRQRVYKLATGTHHLLVASHPTTRCGLKRFSGPLGIAIDRRGRLFVSEEVSHSVRAVAAADGCLLWTFGEPGRSGSGEIKLNGPVGLALVTRGAHEQLVVADRDNQRLVVLNL